MREFYPSRQTRRRTSLLLLSFLPCLTLAVGLCLDLEALTLIVLLTLSISLGYAPLLIDYEPVLILSKTGFKAQGKTPCLWSQVKSVNFVETGKSDQHLDIALHDDHVITVPLENLSTNCFEVFYEVSKHLQSTRQITSIRQKSMEKPVQSKEQKQHI